MIKINFKIIPITKFENWLRIYFNIGFIFTFFTFTFT